MTTPVDYFFGRDQFKCSDILQSRPATEHSPEYKSYFSLLPRDALNQALWHIPEGFDIVKQSRLTRAKRIFLNILSFGAWGRIKRSSLSIALEQGNVNLAKELVSSGADVAFKDKEIFRLVKMNRYASAVFVISQIAPKKFETYLIKDAYEHPFSSLNYEIDNAIKQESITDESLRICLAVKKSIISQYQKQVSKFKEQPEDKQPHRVKRIDVMMDGVKMYFYNLHGVLQNALRSAKGLNHARRVFEESKRLGISFREFKYYELCVFYSDEKKVQNFCDFAIDYFDVDLTKFARPWNSPLCEVLQKDAVEVLRYLIENGKVGDKKKFEEIIIYSTFAPKCLDYLFQNNLLDNEAINRIFYNYMKAKGLKIAQIAIFETYLNEANKARLATYRECLRQEWQHIDAQKNSQKIEKQFREQRLGLFT